MRLVFLLLIMVFAGCASIPPAPQPVTRPSGAVQEPFVMNGRIAIKQGDNHSSANLRWAHLNEEDDILLLAPFGQTVAHIHSDKLGVVLETADKHYTANDTEEISQQVLGWHLPMKSLCYWVLALPSPESKAAIVRNVNDQISLLEQAGWKISYSRYATQTGDSLPLRIILQREGIEFQLLIDEWQIH